MFRTKNAVITYKKHKAFQFLQIENKIEMFFLEEM